MHQKKAFQYLLLLPLMTLLVIGHFACKKPTSPSFKDVYGSGSGSPLPPGTTPTVGPSSHAFLKTWGSLGTAAGQFHNPHFIAVDDVFNIYVTDYSNNRVQKFNSNGQAITQWACDHPQGIAVDNGGNILVAQEQLNSIQAYSNTGDPLVSYSATSYDEKWIDIEGVPPAPVTHTCHWEQHGPVGFALDDAGDQFIADSFVAVSGDCAIPNDFYRTLEMYHLSPQVYTDSWDSGRYSRDGDTTNLIGVAVNQAGTYAYMTDAHNDFVIRQTLPYGTAVTFKGPGTGDDQLQFPHGIAVDRNNHVFVADTTNFRIVEYDDSALAMTYVSQWGTEGSGTGQFESPWGVTVDTAGSIYVADCDNHRIQKFAP